MAKDCMAGDHTIEDRTTEDYMAEDRTTEERIAEDCIAEDRTTEDCMTEDCMAEHRMTEDRMAEHRTTEDRMPEHRTAEDCMAENRMVEERTAEDRTRWNVADLDNIDEHDEDIKGVQDIVRTQFGIEARPWQVNAIRDVARRKLDAVIIAGTGSGKSLIYQSFPAVEQGRIVLVISPTLSLMRDQVNSIRASGITAVDLTADRIRTVPGLWKAVDRGEYSVVLASPEVIFHDGFHFWKTTVRQKHNAFCNRLGLVAVDECHSVYGWREFRKVSSATEVVQAQN